MDASTPSPGPTAHARDRLIGIGLICGAVFAFSLLDATAKFLTAEMSSWQMVWARYTSAFLLSLLLFNPVSHPRLLHTRSPALQFVRGLLLVGSTVFNFWALRTLQLDQATAIGFSTPFIVTMLAGPMLGEYAGWRRWLAIMVGMAGVLVVIRPSFDGIPPAALLQLCSAACYGLYSIITRMLAGKEPAETLLFYSNLVGMLLMMPVVPFVWTMPDSWLLIGLMVLLGCFGGVGHYLVIHAHRLAPPSVVMPFSYTQIIWVTVLGLLVFGDVPDRWTIVGALIVIASGLYLINRERKVLGESGPAASVGPRE